MRPPVVSFVLATSLLTLAACGDASAPSYTRTLPRSSSDAPSGGGKTTAPTEDAPSGPAAQTPALPRRAGVVFVHGTGDQGNVKDLVCSGAGDAYKCIVESAVRDYWTQPNLDSQRQRGDKSLRPYAVIGCPLGSLTPWSNPSPVKRLAGAPAGAEAASADCVAAETRRFLDGPDGKPGTNDDISDVAIVTHSGGSNVVRYIFAQRTKSPEYLRMRDASRRVLAIAPPTRGTYLANFMFRPGSLGNSLNGLLGLFGSEGLYNDDGVAFIQTPQMDASNRDPARLVEVSPDLFGVPMYVAGGSAAFTSLFQSATRCAGNLEAEALATLHSTLLSANDPATYRNDCSDGFISCTSAMATAAGGSRVVFGRLDDGKTIGKSLFRNHNQTRTSCDGVDVDARSAIDGAGMPTFDGGSAAGFFGDSGGFSARALRPVALAVGADHVGAEVALSSEAPIGHWTRASTRRTVSRSARLSVAAGARTRLPITDGRAHVVVTRPGHGFERVNVEGGSSVVEGRDTGAEVELVEAGRPIELAAVTLVATAFVGERASIEVALTEEGQPIAAGAISHLSASLRAPSGAKLPLTAEPGSRDAWILHTSIPAAGEPGDWTARIDAEGTDASGQPFARTVEIVLPVAVPVATIESVEGVDSALGGLTIRAHIAAGSRSHLGLRATLVCASGERRESQTSAVVQRGRSELQLTFSTGCGPGAAGVAGAGYAVTDLALISHDQAMTLSYDPVVSLAAHR